VHVNKYFWHPTSTLFPLFFTKKVGCWRKHP
jgi:hypothetical protein